MQSTNFDNQNTFDQVNNKDSNNVTNDYFIVNMPKLSDTMELGKIFQWIVKEGEYVEQADPLVEIETDKATMEFGSPEQGYLYKILVQAGDSSNLGDPIAVLVNNKDCQVDLDSILSELNQSKGYQKPPTNQENNQTLSDLDQTSLSPQSNDHSRIKISPLAAKLCKQYAIDPQWLSPSSIHQRIVKQDVLDYLQKIDQEKTSSTSITKDSNENHSITASLPSSISTTSDHLPGSFRSSALSSLSSSSQHADHQTTKDTEVIEITPMRKAIAHNLTLSKQQIPHYYLRASYDVGELLETRTQLNTYLIKKGLEKVSINDYIVLACSRALKEHPMVRSFWNNDHILQHNRININVAVAIEDGLLTPVMFDVDQMSLYQLSQHIKTIVKKAKSPQRSGVHLQGGCFTISNLGNSKVDQFCAVINPPQSAILAVASVSDYLQLNNTEATSKKQIQVTMSCDHRVIDGVIGAKFLDTLGELIEHPNLLVL